ncbi:CBS domain-containing protein [Kitasatospora sp. NPDC127111]|uniref:CBS domain-containing protein n=1 Tax=Kitasatospora sp. NPDC127111 TaxID=3345363 RepID=UPI00362EF48A
MRVVFLVIAPPVTVLPGAMAQQAARRMDDEVVGCVPVADRDVLRSIVTERDLFVCALAVGVCPKTPVSWLMSAPAVGVDVADNLSVACRTFRQRGVWRLAVLDGQRPVGLLAIDDVFLDVLQWLSDLLGPLSWSAQLWGRRLCDAIPGETVGNAEWTGTADRAAGVSRGRRAP